MSQDPSQTTNASHPVSITVYRWAGTWGPFDVRIPCGECSLTMDVIKDTLAEELIGIPVQLETREWLSEWWRPLLRGGWHAPIVLVNNRVVSQGHALNRGVLTEAVIRAHVQHTELDGHHLFGKPNCPHCIRAKQYLEEMNLDYIYHDVVRHPRAMYEMLGRTKPLIDSKTPVTVPQIWVHGEYIGGSRELERVADQHLDSAQNDGHGTVASATATY